MIQDFRYAVRLALARPSFSLAAMLRDVEAFNGGAYEDDATLIVAAL